MVLKNKRRKLFFLPIKRPLSWANELAHLEMVGSLVHQLTEGVTIEELEKAGLSAYYTDHGVGLEYIQIRI